MTRREMKERIRELERRVANLEPLVEALAFRALGYVWKPQLHRYPTETTTWPKLGENGSEHRLT